jgi:hypothetical protein
VRASSVIPYALSLSLIFTDRSVLQHISVGRLRIVTNKRTYEFPERGTDAGEDEEFHAELRVINDAFWVRLCMMGDLGLAEAYMFGDVVCEDLISTFRVSTLGFSLLSVQMNLIDIVSPGVSRKQEESRVAKLDIFVALFPPSAAHILSLSQLTRKCPF